MNLRLTSFLILLAGLASASADPVAEPLRRSIARHDRPGSGGASVTHALCSV